MDRDFVSFVTQKLESKAISYGILLHSDLSRDIASRNLKPFIIRATNPTG